MRACDVLIVGGGPAGSSCAWKLRDSGLDIAILDKHSFPRDKVCGGWITPSVLSELEIDSVDYSRGRVFQPITGFRTGVIGGGELVTDYGIPVSYGIRRREFDDYLLKRCGARLIENTPFAGMERTDNGWIVNGQGQARMVIGAGGHFCPVARALGTKTGGEPAVVAQEIEFEMTPAQINGCEVRAERPELYFCEDMKGYGWCFRKGDVLNIGLGRMDPHGLSTHVADFLRFLKSAGRIAFDVPPLRGHAYLLYGTSTRPVAGDGFLLIGDAAGLAYSQSGEGIRPAIESGLMAAGVIRSANGCYRAQQLEPYRAMLATRFGDPGHGWVTQIGSRLPAQWIGLVGRKLLDTHWFARKIVLDRWFLHANQPAFGITESSAA